MDQSWYPDFSIPGGPKAPYNWLCRLAMVYSVYSRKRAEMTNRTQGSQQSPVSGSSSSPRALSAWTRKAFFVFVGSRNKEVSTATRENEGKVQGIFRMTSKIFTHFVLGHCPKTVQVARMATTCTYSIAVADT